MGETLILDKVSGENGSLIYGKTDHGRTWHHIYFDPARKEKMIASFMQKLGGEGRAGWEKSGRIPQGTVWQVSCRQGNAGSRMQVLVWTRHAAQGGDIREGVLRGKIQGYLHHDYLRPEARLRHLRHTIHFQGKGEGPGNWRAINMVTNLREFRSYRNWVTGKFFCHPIISVLNGTSVIHSFHSYQ